MGKGQIYYSSEEVLEIIDSYFNMKRAIGLHVESPYSYSVTADYDNLGMPKGNGTGDPTFRQAFSGAHKILSGVMEKDFMKRINFIDERVPYIKKRREVNVLHWKLSGMRTKHIAELEGITDRQVRNILRKIAKSISEISAISDISNVS
ncbi:hypothetical protein [Lysinibacillus antri]|uniref:Uncharacterized protein n=1 Tax=Lysinibacillus antri TaxID=2498145 RepID=A0A432LI38_9BACI|nr:hypothetical protein [Lysinibacillus antri]RUL56475.1 hypothetical protein EK386_02250 [Lysinibacillus antri]